MNSWNKYNEAFKYLKDKGVIETPFVPEECEHNAHMYYIKLDNIEERTKFINYMKENDILTVFHYIPLHSAPAGREYGVFAGEDKYTTRKVNELFGFHCIITWEKLWMKLYQKYTNILNSKWSKDYL